MPAVTEEAKVIDIEETRKKVEEARDRVAEAAKEARELASEVVKASDPKVVDFPAKAATIKKRLDRRVSAAVEALNEVKETHSKAVEELDKSVRAAARTLQDVVDEEFLRTGKDPEKTPRGQRDPKDVKVHRTNERAYEDASLHRKEELDRLAKEIEGSDEFVNHRKAVVAREEWLDRFLDHYGCAADSIDWDKCQFTLRREDEAELPDELADPFPELEASGGD